MNKARGLRALLIQSAFVMLALGLLLVDLLPLRTLPSSWAGPDLLFGFALAWSVRRPDYVPLYLLAIVFLLADFLLSRPPGLAAALMLLACANMQKRSKTLRDAGFAAEWARAALLIILAAIVSYFVQFVLRAHPPGGLLFASQTVLTALTYPLCVAVSVWVMGVRMVTPGEEVSL